MTSAARPPTTDSIMYQTMHAQPAAARGLLADGWPAATEAAGRLAAARRVYVVGIGTSYHAALVGTWLLRAVGVDARAVPSFDFSTFPDAFPIDAADAVIVMAHSGVKQYSSAALARAAASGAARISVGSLTAEHVGSQQVLRTVARERSAAFTASHLTAMLVLAQIATALGETRQAPASVGWRDALAALPDQIAGVLGRLDEIEPVAQAAAVSRIYAVGAGPNEATALEAVIKVREAARAWIDGLALEQFLHGPLVAANVGDLAVLVNVPGSAAAARTAEITRVLEAIGVRTWLVGADVAPPPAAPAASPPAFSTPTAPDAADRTVFPLPSVPELLSPLLAVVPIQAFAYHLAVARQANPDLFRRDDPRYAAALSLITL
jgi:glucosamine--fructose-6-phosphate aminotransferase (isomerizing)